MPKSLAIARYDYKVLRKSMTFRYEYDFGDTMELLITVVNYTKKALQKEKLTLLSRNNPYEYIVKTVGKNQQLYSIGNVIMIVVQVSCVKTA